MRNTKTRKKKSAEGVLSFLPLYIRNKYFLTFAVFAVYITFFDHYSLLKRHELNKTLIALEREKAQYATTIEESKKLQETINADKVRFARERYYMKRPDEDVFITE